MTEKIITRDIINKNLIFEDQLDNNVFTYNYDYLSSEINKYKNLLEEYDAKEGESALIGVRPGITQISLFFACVELGLTITIIDYSRKDSFTQYKYMDPKTNILIPIDYFFAESRKRSDKIKFFRKSCKNTIIINDIKNFNYSENNKINCHPETSIIKCTSSGTTGTPKKVLHSHEFFYKLVKRNSAFFDKAVGIAFNLNHGSSVATYFLPAICSKNVNRLVNLNVIVPKDLKNVKDIEINHLMVPYTRFLYEINKVGNKDITYYTLSTIPSDLKSDIYKNCYKDILSIFGSNETSGPVLINRINHKDYNENTYFKVDDFYDIDIINNTLNVTLPVYDTVINTNDCFYLNNEIYIFLGRDDLTRINGQIVPLKKYDNITKENIDADLIYDYVFQEIYLAIWNDSKDCQKRIKRINKFIKNYSNGNHFIKKSKILKKEEFLSGVKLDQELLREYFRRYT